MLLAKAQGGCTIAGYTWKNDGDAVEVPGSFGAELLAIQGGDFSEVPGQPDPQPRKPNGRPAKGGRKAVTEPAPEPAAAVTEPAPAAEPVTEGPADPEE